MKKDSDNEELIVQEYGSSGETIKQQKLKVFAQRRDEFLLAKKRYYDAYHDVEHMLINGADVQNGKLGVKHGIKYVRRRSYKQDLIDLKGVTYQIRLLESTAPHAEFYWRLTHPKNGNK